MRSPRSSRLRHEGRTPPRVGRRRCALRGDDARTRPRRSAGAHQRPCRHLVHGGVLGNHGRRAALAASSRDPHRRYEVDCFDCATPVTHIAWYDTARITNVLDWLLLPLALIFVVMLVRKLVRATPGGRRVVLPLSIAAFAAIAQLVAHFVLNG